MLYRISPRLMWLLAAVWGGALVILAAYFLSGDSPVDEAAKPPAAAAGPKIEKLALDKLPETPNSSPPVDGGRFVAAIPADWSLAPRSSKWMIRMRRYQGDSYPTILIQADDHASDGKGILSLDGDSVLVYTERLQQELSTAGKLDSLSQPPQAFQAGEVFGVSYLQRAASGGKKLDRFVLMTIQQGRKYTFELQTIRGTLRLFRASGYAAVARSKYLPGASGETPGETPAEQPAEPATPDKPPAAQPPAAASGG